MSIIQQEDRRNYLGATFVYFDGTHVAECKVGGVQDVWTLDLSTGSCKMETRFSIAAKDGKSVWMRTVPMENLYMNWSCWMRSMLLKGHSLATLEASIDFTSAMRKHVNDVKFVAETLLDGCKLCESGYDRTSLNMLSETVEDALDDLKAYKSRWEGILRHNMPVGCAEDWRAVLIHLIKHQMKKEKSRQARKEWRKAHAVQ